MVLDEVLGLELSTFTRLLKLRPRVNDDHVLVQQVASNLWFRQLDYKRKRSLSVQRNLTSSEEDLMALVLWTKPNTNAWLYLSSRVLTLKKDAFEHAPAVIKEILVCLENLLNESEQAEGMMLQLMRHVNTISLDKFQADVLATRAHFLGRSDAILEGMRMGWTPSLLSTCSPRSSKNLIASFVKDVKKLSIGFVLALCVKFGQERFVKRPATLFTQALADLRLDGPSP